jgi:hypothetical protein
MKHVDSGTESTWEDTVSLKVIVSSLAMGHHGG